MNRNSLWTWSHSYYSKAFQKFDPRVQKVHMQPHFQGVKKGNGRKSEGNSLASEIRELVEKDHQQYTATRYSRANETPPGQQTTVRPYCNPLQVVSVTNGLLGCVPNDNARGLPWCHVYGRLQRDIRSRTCVLFYRNYVSAHHHREQQHQQRNPSPTLLSPCDTSLVQQVCLASSSPASRPEGEARGPGGWQGRKEKRGVPMDD